jgi:hypothetical protein
MKTTLGVSISTGYGLLMHQLFLLSGGLVEVMTMAFLVIIPVIIGFITVIAVGSSKVTSTAKGFLYPWISCSAILIITLLLNIEGAICWFMIAPFFFVLAGLGGLLAYHRIKPKIDYNENYDFDFNKDENNTTKNKLGWASLIIIVPYLAGMAEMKIGHNDELLEKKQSLTINAAKDKVWQCMQSNKLVNLQHYKPGLVNALGFPKHISTELDSFYVGAKRKAIFEHGLYFDEQVLAVEKEKRVLLAVKTDPAKIPASVMDEHILIGGKHIRMYQDEYTLTDNLNGTTTVSLSSKYFINTPFNWYCKLWSQALISSVLKAELQLIKVNSESIN